MKLVFYSGGQSPKNRQLHGALADLAGSHGHSKKTFAYLPFCTEGAEIFFKRAEKRYKPFGFKNFLMLRTDTGVGTPAWKEGRKRVLDSDVIYLAGGNTFYFLKHLRRSGLLNDIAQYARKDFGVLAGLSAGALLMTPNIGLAGYPEHLADENEVRLKDLTAMGLVDFEFFPHFERSRRLSEQLRKYSLRSRYSILASHDGGGVVAVNDELTLFGRTALWSRGHAYELRPQIKSRS